MKQTIFLAITFVLLVFPCSAQEQNQIMSDSAKELAQKIKTGNYESILEMGNLCDNTIIPYLKTLASEGTNWLVRDYAQMALAKLGETDYLNQILAQVDADNPDIQDKAMEKLAYVSGKKVLRKFQQLLDDNAERENPQCKIDLENFKKQHPEGGNCGLCCDVIFFSRSTMATFFLAKTVKNPPTTKIGGENIRIWKEWFEKNKHLIE